MKLLLSGILSLWLLPDSPAAQTPASGRAPDPSARQVETYESAVIDRKGNLRITTSDRRTIVVPKKGEQSSFRKPVLSADRTAVGAQADYPNCCTSYDIPLQLVVYADGTVHRFTGIGLPIFQWHFADGGSRVAFGQETVHFGCSVHYELRDIQSEQRLDSADVPQPCGGGSGPPKTTIPRWVKALNAARQ